MKSKVVGEGHEGQTSRSVGRPLLWSWANCALALLCMLTSPLAFALDPTEALSELVHTQWTTRQGAPEGINAIVQGADGYLWLGTEIGLYRFDGNRFQQFVRPDNGQFITEDVSALYATAAGGLWIGLQTGGAYFYDGRRIIHYGSGSGLSGHSVLNFAVRLDGSVWAQTGAGLYYLQNEHWHQAGTDWNYPATTGYAAFVDRQGTLWSREEEGTFFLPRDGHVFQKSPVPGGQGWIQSSPDGEVWVADFHLGLLTLTGPTRVITGQSLDKSITQTGGVFCFDKDGSLWTLVLAGRPPQAYLIRATRMAHSDRSKDLGVQRLQVSDSLITGGANAMLEDTEGDIWVAGDGGLDRFRANKLHAAVTPVAIGNSAIMVDAQGSVLLSSYVEGRLFAQGQSTPSMLPRLSDVSGRFSALLADNDGGVLVALESSEASLEKYLNGKIVNANAPLGVHGAQAIAKDSSGALWISLIGVGVYKRENGTWTRNGGLTGLPAGAPLFMIADSSDRMWFGYPDNKLLRITSGKVQEFGVEDGLAVGNPLFLTVRGAHTWIGGSNGTMYYDGKRFWPITDSDGLGFPGVSGIVEDNEGGLWLNGATSLAHLAPKQVQDFVLSPRSPVESERLDYQDGRIGTAEQLRPLPSAVEGGDGRVWVTTAVGEYWIDPKHIARHLTPPPVFVTSIVSAGTHYDPADVTAFPVRTSSFEVDYTALSLSNASRVRFKYKMDGVDRSWQDAGSRRQAFYTNIAPGSYKFHVIAANEDGVWNEAGATASFTIPPTFFQTRLFIALCVLGAILVLWQLFRLRLLQLQGRIGARHQERERIARELHDTLIQSTQGMILMFQGFAGELPRSEDMRQRMEGALDKADTLLNEARDRVNDLRITAFDSDIEQAFARAGEELFLGRGTEFSILISGAVRTLMPHIADDVYRIGREALINAANHSSASRIEVEIAFEANDLRIRVRDNGAGLTKEVIEGGRSRHFGIQGMRERAARIGGRFYIWSGQGSGTEIELTIPAARAYRNAPLLRRWVQSFLPRRVH
jgi:signal transduction histidine kinase/ligand-binding sensor domain-containing protein